MSDDGKQSSLLPPTELLYMTYDGNFLTECVAKVLSVGRDLDQSSNGGAQIVLDRTVLHAQGGGQPSDTGNICFDHGNDRQQPVFSVTKVTVNRDRGVAIHNGSFNDGVTGQTLNTGDAVIVSVDETRRRILSECHTAGHVVDSAMALCGKLFKPSKAYHFLDGPYVEYEGIVPLEERGPLLGNLQAAFHQLVEDDIATTIELMSKEQADAVCNRQAQNFDLDTFADKRTEQIRVVTVAGFPCPCGGTHVGSSSDLKDNRWGVTGIKFKKETLRVKYGQNCSPA